MSLFVYCIFKPPINISRNVMMIMNIKPHLKPWDGKGHVDVLSCQRQGGKPGWNDWKKIQKKKCFQSVFTRTMLCPSDKASWRERAGEGKPKRTEEFIFIRNVFLKIFQPEEHPMRCSTGSAMWQEKLTPGWDEDLWGEDKRQKTSSASGHGKLART